MWPLHFTSCSVYGLPAGRGLHRPVLQLHHEWVILANLFLLLMGFAILSRHFENSRVPDAMPAFLPNGWAGGLALLAIVFVLSSFLDNIAAALIGGTMARHVFKGKVHIGYLAAIVAASNAGGSGSVVGDTTTTMMWIDGISPLRVVEAYVAADSGISHLRHPRRAPATCPLSDHQGCVARATHRLVFDRRRCRDPRHRHQRQCHRQSEIPRSAGRRSRDRSRGLDCDHRSRPAAPPGLGNHARDVQGHDLPACARYQRFVHARRTAPGSPPGKPRWAWASCRRCSTTFR